MVRRAWRAHKRSRFAPLWPPVGTRPPLSGRDAAYVAPDRVIATASACAAAELPIG
jgi:hypothetical protein